MRKRETCPSPLWLCPARGVQSGRRIGSAPRDVSGGSIGRRHPIFEQPKADPYLGSVMCRMENPPPENPDSLTTHVKERHFGQPESLVSGGKRNEALAQYKEVLARPNIYDAHDEAKKGLRQAYRAELAAKPDVEQ